MSAGGPGILYGPNKFYQEDPDELVATENISKYDSCPTCQQKKEYSDKKKILPCVCGSTMKRKILSSNWVLKISCLKQNGEALHLIVQKS